MLSMSLIDFFSVKQQVFKFLFLCVFVCFVLFLIGCGLHDLIFKVIQANAWLL